MQSEFQQRDIDRYRQRSCASDSGSDSKYSYFASEIDVDRCVSDTHTEIYIQTHFEIDMGSHIAERDIDGC